jgi:hypothetical protein
MLKIANTATTARAASSAQAAGIPYFKADDLFVYAIYPDGRRVVVEKIRPLTVPTVVDYARMALLKN